MSFSVAMYEIIPKLFTKVLVPMENKLETVNQYLIEHISKA